jgi:lipopolysaccharide cholinephosphotransferase
MKTIETAELKQVQIAMLKHIHDLCEKEGLQYVLAYGTLLGAIRHKGYIPWDDDIDIAMPRPDYDRFFKIYHSDIYEALNCENKENYPYVFGKVYDKRTIMQENISFKQETGIYVDVFPLDGIPENIADVRKIVRKIRFYRNIQNLKKNKITGGINRNILKQLIFIVLQIPVLFIPYQYIIRKINQLSKMYNYDKARFVMEMYWNNAEQRILKENIAERLLADFEDSKFYIPKGYDEWLTKIYGNYMQEPPENKRESTHKFLAWWKD